MGQGCRRGTAWKPALPSFVHVKTCSLAACEEPVLSLSKESHRTLSDVCRGAFVTATASWSNDEAPALSQPDALPSCSLLGISYDTMVTRQAQETFWVIPESYRIGKRWCLLSITHNFEDQTPERGRRPDCCHPEELTSPKREGDCWA